MIVVKNDRIQAYIDINPELYKTVTEDFPYFIAHEYRRFYELLDNKQYFGAYFEMKDVLEVLLKFPILLGTAYIDKLCTDEGQDCLKELLRKQMSLGDWASYGNSIAKKLKKDQQVRPLYRALKDILGIYGSENVVRWRNTRIGHGAVAGDIMQYAQDFKRYTEAVNRHLGNCRDFYSNLKICLGEWRLEGNCLPDWQMEQASERQIPEGLENQSLEARYGELVFVLQPYIFVKGQYIYFFDSMNSWRLVVDAMDYINGRRIVLQSEFFLKKYHDLIDADRQQVKGTIGDVLLSGDNNYLNGLNEAQDFVPMENLHQWVMNSLENYDRGVFLLQMERGMGKTAFVSSLDPLLRGDDCDAGLAEMDAVVRCYYCSRLEFRSTSDFVGACNTGMFSKNKDANMNLESSERELKMLTLDSADPAGQMCAYLKDYRDIYQMLRYKEKLVLIIDGLDEIAPDRLLETGNTIFDYIPPAEQLPEDVYLFLTCRTGREELLTAFVQERLEKIHITETYIVQREDDSHIRNLKRFLRRRADQTVLPGDAADRMLDAAGRNFVELKLLLSLLDMGIKLQDLLEIGKASMLNLFLEKLEKAYGEKMSARASEFLTLIVNAYEPLSMDQIAFLLGYSELPTEIITIVYDMECLLDLKRTDGGTRIRLANEAFREKLSNKYQPLMQEQLSRWIDMILIQGRQELRGEEKNDLYNHEGAIYLYGNIMKYVGQWALQAQRERVYTEEFALSLYRFEARVDGRNHGYRGVLLDIDMSSAAADIFARLEECGQTVDRLTWAYTLNNKGYHRGITLSDGLGAEEDFERAYAIAAGIPEKNEMVLSAMGTFSNNMAALKSKLQRPFEETAIWNQRSMTARKELMNRDFAAGAENYMQSALNYAGLLCSYGKTEQLGEVYAEMRDICGRIRSEYPQAEGMLRAKGNRVNFGYVFQLASARMKYGQCLEKEEHGCKEARELYQKSIDDFQYLLDLTDGKQMAVHESLYKAWFFLGKNYMEEGKENGAEDCWENARKYVRQLKDSGKLYENATLKEMKKIIPDLREICQKSD